MLERSCDRKTITVLKLMVMYRAVISVIARLSCLLPFLLDYLIFLDADCSILQPYIVRTQSMTYEVSLNRVPEWLVSLAEVKVGCVHMCRMAALAGNTE